ncbi:MAG: Maf family protein [Chloroflexi bacterium]|nr:Maf family protein [Chloroflexota bacterium]MCY4248263.1 Maf family protein [Chloroflexota bacterium]
MRIILASSSPRRKQLLARLGLRFDIIVPAIDESRLPAEDLVEYAQRLSRQKAAAVLAHINPQPSLIIAADTIVEQHGDLLGKPPDARVAQAMLLRLRGQAHTVISGFTVRRVGDFPRIITRHARTTVHMRDYSEGEIATYIASGDPFDKAGGYAIQNTKFHPVARIEGSYSNVVGLPLEALRRALGELGLSTAL